MSVTILLIGKSPLEDKIPQIEETLLTGKILHSIAVEEIPQLHLITHFKTKIDTPVGISTMI